MAKEKIEVWKETLLFLMNDHCCGIIGIEENEKQTLLEMAEALGIKFTEDERKLFEEEPRKSVLIAFVRAETPKG